MDHRGSRHGRGVDKDRQWVGGLREAGVENGSCCDGSSNHHGVGSGDGNRRDGGCSHGMEVDHGRSSRQMVDSHRLDGMVGASESGSGRCGEPHLGSVQGLSPGADWGYEWGNVHQPGSERWLL